MAQGSALRRCPEGAIPEQEAIKTDLFPQTSMPWVSRRISDELPLSVG